ncbi:MULTISPECIES: hypothetical protein [unclassified Thermosipho (in: thermotogales)]|uniref:hypothetical protein n=1 Tax=unclassified Thermosipho (in: thermotogales) TaxID=2676525 RepID=UPI0009494807|nr:MULTISPECIES: hypothetical protein [unclassified Thermosipho (in: thermotogales)]ANQ54598.1 hypothetical protein Y592_04085 [Thermosipho sp. 1070]OOC44194.1 hypothetical protein XO08_03955 [Thermosipho sp. 1074]
MFKYRRNYSNLKNYTQKTNSGKLSDYWDNFKPLSIAFYDNSYVYIIGFDNPPKNFIEEQGIFIGKWIE